MWQGDKRREKKERETEGETQGTGVCVQVYVCVRMCCCIELYRYDVNEKARLSKVNKVTVQGQRGRGVGQQERNDQQSQNP